MKNHKSLGTMMKKLILFLNTLITQRATLPGPEGKFSIFAKH